MLTVTDAAVAAIKNASKRCGVLDDGGLRLDVAPNDTAGRTFAVSLATAPRSGDQVLVVRPGTNVFMPADAAERLTDTILDVRETDGKVKFRLLRRG
nr:hypothetical protein [Kibdelosporangium sp. MJ126-NF4]CEL17573.1 hypothetical protein [Kibdelosporangium sp. MJ126-NF4]CTQ91200.1 hypothetical protein [Kibdelosporangium sp. MJ126-NF4]